jgi:hypothetical protein
MTVFQFTDHIGEHFKELTLAHSDLYLSLILVVDGIPVNLFVGKETVMLIHDSPQCFEISLWTIVVFFLIDAGNGEKQTAAQQEVFSYGYISHSLILL